MVNLPLNPYLLWFRDRGQEAPNVDGDGGSSPSSEIAPTGSVLGAATQSQDPYWLQLFESTPVSQSDAQSTEPPGLRIEPRDDSPGFNLKPEPEPIGFNLVEGGVPDHDERGLGAFSAESTPPQYPAWLRAPSPPAGLPGLWVNPQEDLPGFNLKPPAEQIGFNLNQDHGWAPGSAWPDVPASPLDSIGTIQSELAPAANTLAERVPDGLSAWSYNMTPGLPLPLNSFGLRTDASVLPASMPLNNMLRYPPKEEDTRGPAAAPAYASEIDPHPSAAPITPPEAGPPIERSTSQPGVTVAPSTSDAPPIESAVYRSSDSSTDNDLFQLAGIGENREQGKAAEDAAVRAIIKDYPDAKVVQNVGLYAKGVPGYSIADVMYTRNGLVFVAIHEVKSGLARLSPQQIVVLSEAARTGNVSIANPDIGKQFGMEPGQTFAEKGIMPLVSVSGGNDQAIARQLRNQGIEVVPEGVGRGGRPARLRLGGPPS